MLPVYYAVMLLGNSINLDRIHGHEYLRPSALNL